MHSGGVCIRFLSRDLCEGTRYGVRSIQPRSTHVLLVLLPSWISPERQTPTSPRVRFKCLPGQSDSPRRLPATRLQRLLHRFPPPDATQTDAHPPGDIPLRDNTHAQ